MDSYTLSIGVHGLLYAGTLLQAMFYRFNLLAEGDDRKSFRPIFLQAMFAREGETSDALCFYAFLHKP